MNKVQVLSKRAEYVAVYERGKGWGNGLLTMKVLGNELDVPRFGFSVGKEVGKAVARNRVRRLLREIARKAMVKPGWDIVFIARRGVAEADYHQLKASVEKLLSRARLKSENETVNVGVD